MTAEAPRFAMIAAYSAILPKRWMITAFFCSRAKPSVVADPDRIYFCTSASDRVIVIALRAAVP